MSEIRIMIADDSVVIRGALSRILGNQPDMRVVGNARNGRQTLERIEVLRPDILVLDIEMPELDGLQVLQALRHKNLPVKVLIFSSHTTRGARVTVDALSLWAHDYVLKPSTTGLDANATAEILITKIRTLAYMPERTSRLPGEHLSPAAESPSPQRNMALWPLTARRVDVVAIAASTGGPKALTELLAGLPASLRTPVLIVQHMPPEFTRQLAVSLDRRSPLDVCQGEQGDRIAPGRVYLAPGGHHMGLRQTVLGEVILHLHDGPPENQCRPAADVLFRDVATIYGKGALGVVLTGMGRDGLAGAHALVAAGGCVLAQDRATSVVWGMPGQVASNGLARAILPLADIPGRIAAMVRYGGTVS